MTTTSEDEPDDCIECGRGYVRITAAPEQDPKPVAYANDISIELRWDGTKCSALNMLLTVVESLVSYGAADPTYVSALQTRVPVILEDEL